VGEEILEQGLIIQVKDRHDLVRALIRGLSAKRTKPEVIRSARQYVEERKGGTERACQEIEAYLREKPVRQ
jgi:3-deoxy-D-manno-octulosonic-acid transferase